MLPVCKNIGLYIQLGKPKKSRGSILAELPLGANPAVGHPAQSCPGPWFDSLKHIGDLKFPIGVVEREHFK